MERLTNRLETIIERIGIDRSFAVILLVPSVSLLLVATELSTRDDSMSWIRFGLDAAFFALVLLSLAYDRVRSRRWRAWTWLERCTGVPPVKWLVLLAVMVLASVASHIYYPFSGGLVGVLFLAVLLTYARQFRREQSAAAAPEPVEDARS